ncbi:MAG: lipolytic enzyme [Myxococcaceae bacterium]|nr:lipolytic enzyme [Myxococcaceae bacterium]
MKTLLARVRSLLGREPFEVGAHWQQRSATFRVDCQRLARRGAEQWVLLGDSLTEEFPRPLLRLVDPRCVNRGISGDQLAGGPTTMVERLSPDVLAPRPVRLLLAGGINDLHAMPEHPQRVFERMVEVASQARALYPEVELTLQSLLPTRGRYAYLNHGLCEVNLSVERFARTHGAAYLDLHRLLSGPSGALRPLFSRDGLHLKASAYLVWALALKRAWSKPFAS